MSTIVLFLFCFCLASIALYEPEAENLTTVDNFENFYSAVKEVLAPESEVEAPPSLPTAQTDVCHPTEMIVNSVSVTPADQTTPQFTIRQLREYVRQHNLQATIKEQLGKSVNHCCKEELLSVLFA